MVEPSQEIEVREDGHFDFDCPVCMTIMAEPSSLPCKHTICMQCIRMIQESNPQCPLCRTKLAAGYIPVVNEVLQKKFKERAPDKYAERYLVLPG